MISMCRSGDYPSIRVIWKDLNKSKKISYSTIRNVIKEDKKDNKRDQLK